MKIDFSKELIGLDGNPLKDEKDKVVTLSVPCINALLASEEKTEPVEKMARFVLAQKISKAKEKIDLSIEDVAKIKELVGKFMPTLVMGSVWEILENKE